MQPVPNKFALGRDGFLVSAEEESGYWQYYCLFCRSPMLFVAKTADKPACFIHDPDRLTAVNEERCVYLDRYRHQNDGV